jgi:hypothetical protein
MNYLFHTELAQRPRPTVKAPDRLEHREGCLSIDRSALEKEVRGKQKESPGSRRAREFHAWTEKEMRVRKGLVDVM